MPHYHSACTYIQKKTFFFEIRFMNLAKMNRFLLQNAQKIKAIQYNKQQQSNFNLV